MSESGDESASSVLQRQRAALRPTPVTNTVGTPGSWSELSAQGVRRMTALPDGGMVRNTPSTDAGNNDNNTKESQEPAQPEFARPEDMTEEQLLALIFPAIGEGEDSQEQYAVVDEDMCTFMETTEQEKAYCPSATGAQPWHFDAHRVCRSRRMRTGDTASCRQHQHVPRKLSFFFGDVDDKGRQVAILRKRFKGSKMYVYGYAPAIPHTVYVALPAKVTPQGDLTDNDDQEDDADNDDTEPVVCTFSNLPMSKSISPSRPRRMRKTACCNDRPMPRRRL